jgi:hypothetical protein
MSQNSLNDTDSILARYDKNWQALEQADQQAKAQGVLLNRYIKHAYADGYAVYRITKVNKASVQVRVVTGIGDDWVLPAWGREATIPLRTAQQLVSFRDATDAIFEGE